MRLSQPPSILYVDDNCDACEMMSLMLKFSDDRIRVKTISDAAEAVALIAQESFDLYILDYTMPQMTGVELCRRIRETDGSTPILFYSGRTLPADRAAALAAGATNYLVKPNDLDQLLSTACRLVSEASVSNQLTAS